MNIGDDKPEAEEFGDCFAGAQVTLTEVPTCECENLPEPTELTITFE